MGGAANGSFGSLALLVVAACTHAAPPLPEGHDPGTGTSTLEVTVQIDTSAFQTATPGVYSYPLQIRADVRKGGVPLEEATVTVTTDDEILTLSPRFDRSGNRQLGIWVFPESPAFPEVDESLYRERFVLDVVRGDDRVSGVRIDGPDMHQIVAPTDDDVIDPAVPLVIEWTRRESAELTTLNVHDNGRGLFRMDIADTGNFTLPAESVRNADGSYPGYVGVELLRRNEVIPAGALVGSWVRMVVVDYAGLTIAR